MRGHGKSDMRSSRRDFLAFSRLLFMGASALVLCPLSLDADNIEALDLETIDPSTGLMLAQVCRPLTFGLASSRGAGPEAVGTHRTAPASSRSFSRSRTRSRSTAMDPPSIPVTVHSRHGTCQRV